LKTTFYTVHLCLVFQTVEVQNPKHECVQLPAANMTPERNETTPECYESDLLYIYFITAATSSNYCTLLQCKRLCQVITCELSEKKLGEFAVPRSGKLLEFGVDGARKVGCLGIVWVCLQYTQYIAFVADDETR
jgi:hypothetical protein